jgi:hypothetical protein
MSRASKRKEQDREAMWRDGYIAISADGAPLADVLTAVEELVEVVIILNGEDVVPEVMLSAPVYYTSGDGKPWREVVEDIVGLECLTQDVRDVLEDRSEANLRSLDLWPPVVVTVWTPGNEPWQPSKHLGCQR